MLAFLLLVGLGTWQLYRLAWKTQLISFRQSQLAAVPVALPADLVEAEKALATLDYRRARISGVFLHGRELYLAATRRSHFGFDVITPLRRADGAVVLVDRGWVPPEARDPAARAAGQTTGEVTVEGVLRGPGRAGWFTPDNDPERNYWFWRDLGAMARVAGVEAPALLLEAGPAKNPGGLPIGRDYRVDLPNDHLSYAITWYMLAVALAVIYVLSQRRGPDDD
ncbi:MAG: SURF1 family protein [Alphaproteobacteria bacterium]